MLEDKHSLSFHWIDYAVFAMSLAMSLATGFFFCMHGKRQSSNEQYLLGGRNINPISVGISMTASIVNAVLLIGAPSEIYYRGVIFSLFGVSWIPATCIVAHVFVPKYREMKTTSAYEFLEMRFNSISVRLIGSLIFSGSIILFLAVVLYAPAMAIAQVTGQNIHAIQLVCGLVCTIYVFLGGMKAVAWTDTLQMVIMVLGTITVAIIGAQKVGGFSEVWNIAKQDNRINFYNLSFDPTVRHTIWTQVIGQMFISLSIIGANQMMIQRYKVVRTTTHAQIAVYVQLVMMLLLTAILVISGLVMYAYFRKCDPLLAPGYSKVAKPDQIFPLFMMEIMSSYPGLPGLYIAAVFAGALSSISSCINSLAAVILEDFIKPVHLVLYKRRAMKESTEVYISKGLTLIFGLLTIALSYIAPLMGDVIVQIPMTIWSITCAPLFGMFLLAIFFPCANAVGTIAGVLSSVIFAFWLSVGGILYGRPAPIIHPLGLDCSSNISGKDIESLIQVSPVMLMTQGTVTNTKVTAVTPEVRLSDGLMDFYSISYSWYGLISLSLCVIVGLLVSCISKGLYYGCIEKRWFLNRKLYQPASKCFRCFPRSTQKFCSCHNDLNKDPEKIDPNILIQSREETTNL